MKKLEIIGMPQWHIWGWFALRSCTDQTRIKNNSKKKKNQLTVLWDRLKLGSSRAASDFFGLRLSNWKAIAKFP